MRAIKNRNVIYTGKVGAKLKPLRRGLFSSKRVCKTRCDLVGGPFGGCHCRLDAAGDRNTLTFTARGQTGRYVNGAWISVETAAARRAVLAGLGVVA